MVGRNWRAGWRCVWAESGELSVATSGMTETPVWCVRSWDTVLKVRSGCGHGQLVYDYVVTEVGSGRRGEDGIEGKG